ncbi:MAG: SGNH/GDSL hydrolase family protein [Deltaproteobacteria bacterium]|nr:SGNH/GDSL hydrolase family protein [Deltaproteobacteria bacterium]
MKKSMTKTILRCIGVLVIIMLALGGRAVGLQAAEIAQKIAFFGDSITANGWSNQTGYVNLTIAGLKANGIRVFAIPAGIGGHKSNQMLERLKRDVLDKKPDWITLSCGVNDVWQGSQGVPLDQYKINITAIVDRCRAAGVKVVILTATVIGEELDNDYNKKLASYNEFLRSLAKEKRCLLADLNALFQKRIKIIPKSGRLLTSDGVHMNPAGDKVMAEGILRAFELNHAQIKKAQDAWMEISGSLNLPMVVKGINENLPTGRHYLPVIFPHHRMVAMKKGVIPRRSFSIDG